MPKSTIGLSSTSGARLQHRNQFGPSSRSASDNPWGMHSNLFNRWGRPAPVAQMGRTPGLMGVTLRGCKLGAGQIRVLWRQSVNYFAAQPAHSWTDNGYPGLEARPHGFQITRALRYMTRSVYMGSGTDNTRFAGLHTAITPRIHSKPVTLGAGQVRSRPTVRNRITSFGSRVPTINQPVQAAEDQ